MYETFVRSFGASCAYSGVRCRVQKAESASVRRRLVRTDLGLEFEGDRVEFSLDLAPDGGDVGAQEGESAGDDGEVHFAGRGEEAAGDKMPNEAERVAVHEEPGGGACRSQLGRVFLVYP